MSKHSEGPCVEVALEDRVTIVVDPATGSTAVNDAAERLEEDPPSGVVCSSSRPSIAGSGGTPATPGRESGDIHELTCPRAELADVLDALGALTEGGLAGGVEIQSEADVIWPLVEPQWTICDDLRPPRPCLCRRDLDELARMRYGRRDCDCPPSFHSVQRYLGPASKTRFGGIDAAVAWGIPGGRGSGVTIADVEWGWEDHRDLKSGRYGCGASSRGSSSNRHRAHGRAVEGILAARVDGKGMDGIASDAVAVRYPISSRQPPSVRATLLKAVEDLDEGDVILLETHFQQIHPTPGGSFCRSPFLPHEMADSVFRAIECAIEKGIHVVQAAGNGTRARGADLDCYLEEGRDSGAILVAAGQPCSGERIASSNYGRRVDLFSWGHSVLTLGLQDFHEDRELAWKGDGKNPYQVNFGGTSAAAAIVAGAAACLSGIVSAQGHVLSPTEMRALLVDTGYSKLRTDCSKIGLHPNLRSACKALQERRLIPGGTVI